MSLDDPWEALELQGRRTGHVVGRCPRCGQRQMMPYSPPSTPWPRCVSCLMPGVWTNVTVGYRRLQEFRRAAPPRLECLSDLSQVIHKRPGEPRTKTQLALDGCIVRPEALASADGEADAEPAGPPDPPGSLRQPPDEIGGTADQQG